MSPIAYDPSRIALFQPQRRGLPALSSDMRPDAIAAVFAILAYYRFEAECSQQHEIAAVARGLGYTVSGWFGDGSQRGVRRLHRAKGVGAVNEVGDAIIAFRGTQSGSFGDLLTNVNVFRHNVAAPARGRVHRGFAGALASIRHQADNWLASTKHRHLFITGHSLGAAMATLLAAYYPAATLITFGSPLIGDQTFADSFAGRTVRRYVNCCDTVTTVPPAILTYRHLDGLRYIDRNGRIHTEAVDYDADKKAAGRNYPLRLRLNWQNVPLRRLADHAPINYLSAIMRDRIGP